MINRSPSYLSYAAMMSLLMLFILIVGSFVADLYYHSGQAFPRLVSLYDRWLMFLAASVIAGLVISLIVVPVLRRGGLWPR